MPTIDFARNYFATFEKENFKILSKNLEEFYCKGIYKDIVKFKNLKYFSFSARKGMKENVSLLNNNLNLRKVRFVVNEQSFGYIKIIRNLLDLAYLTKKDSILEIEFNKSIGVDTLCNGKELLNYCEKYNFTWLQGSNNYTQKNWYDFLMYIFKDHPNKHKLKLVIRNKILHFFEK